MRIRPACPPGARAGVDIVPDKVHSSGLCQPRRCGTAEPSATSRPGARSSTPRGRWSARRAWVRWPCATWVRGWACGRSRCTRTSRRSTRSTTRCSPTRTASCCAALAGWRAAGPHDPMAVLRREARRVGGLRRRGPGPLPAAVPAHHPRLRAQPGVVPARRGGAGDAARPAAGRLRHHRPAGAGRVDGGHAGPGRAAERRTSPAATAGLRLVDEITDMFLALTTGPDVQERRDHEHRDDRRRPTLPRARARRGDGPCRGGVRAAARAGRRPGRPRTGRGRPTAPTGTSGRCWATCSACWRC